MVEVIESATFSRWIRSLRDRRAVARINIRIRQASEGHFGDIRAVGSGVSEMRIHYGPGYRLYFARKGQQLIILLCGDDKDSQQRDIHLARQLAQEWR
ncbi:MAG: type II toxin-antitoxin system RelE/ParE family toxin [Chloroflexi bacterium]|nr:type II toxin-antitoxin system RelE/ParE family toxin [Chloroflexota bacterium]